MAKIKGISFVLKFGQEILGGKQGASLSLSSDTIDSTTADSEGWKEKDYSFKEWTISTDGLLVKNDACYDKVEEALFNGTVLDIVVDRAGKLYTGKCLVTSIENDAPYDDNMSYSINLEGTGALVKSGSATLSK